ncbi:hypothetical protein MUN82_04340 [Hymenobacter aerilatus]|uniref:Uncharacterized protein n=1 Tax=Hymenobacter aerilatus TaxID=2932251 RepID=A0A8T9T2X6_9BACT|nr:hypothetical protein [Hymenobacter aerilatus]UOR06329.1 hypothetical protein MUN82_04340 [Hymenobacter aerilatus]
MPLRQLRNITWRVTLPYPTLPYPTLPYPTLPYPTLPYPTLPYPTRCQPNRHCATTTKKARHTAGLLSQERRVSVISWRYTRR